MLSKDSGSDPKGPTRTIDDHPEDSDTLSLEQENEREIIEHPQDVTQKAQAGVQKAEAAALVWSKPALYSTYVLIWVCFFVLSMQSSISNNMIYYAYASFASAPQISQSFILATIIGGVIQLPIAKMLNLWGRAEGFLIFLSIFILGLIVIASCDGPKGFAAGYTLYNVGYTALNFILSVFVADASGLRNRAFAYAFTGTPSICTAFVGPLAAQALYEHSTWRWAYGCFAIIAFVIFTPLALIFKFYQRKAEKLNILVREHSGRTLWQSIVYVFHEFDVIGVFLLMAAFILFLLPFSLETYGYSGYSSATFIAMVVIGILLFPVFIVWERFFARTEFIKWRLFRSRTVIGACGLSAVIFFNYYVWDQYFYYYVQVVYNLDTSKTGYMTEIYSVGSTIWAVMFGIWIRQTKHFKNICLYFGAPLMLLGAGLMIHFRGTQSQIGYLIMCQILIAFGGGTLVIGDEMAAMAAADRDGVPLMIAMLSLSSSIGGAIGYAVASAIYTNTFPSALLRALPDSAKADYETIYLGGSTTQLQYPPGSDVRNAINYAWAQSQKYECIAAAAVVVLAFPAIAVWKNYNVDRKQVKGTVI
ncbi:siderochrome-iron transporter, putative [Talaromyces stipitatus ATCC 10500]|uniref:Siderochrome-iron transporter, putative n=1 Tax=Talaromyces stipitatus (strain ATCC 10500 / CBS 375.48 / QM 6759 / NRRL 1006) TaxID=441959 RepID=B8MHP7_TALSN|nr:siderochrome-iron transporter, putative [Talaromyces stipitatus ATCC 10500]XP_002483263.1 siderochrome-iron transporter, putative [Talaromyces stipitatus ATCC 10500]EED16028.1 siderochrome-iron transporter, putative [Talaromyces stipitatus ATCC 10500]EED16029.1 siderochrome-iron transporter, putative [Talaromyces stipitatus ATCC 10500]